MPEQKFDLIVSNPPFYVNHILPGSKLMQSAKHATASPAEWIDAMTRIIREDGKIGLILPYTTAFDWIREANQRQWFCTNRLDVLFVC
jgi:tRNA1Val (adenine37-N6)-methyltransferase